MTDKQTRRIAIVDSGRKADVAEAILSLIADRYQIVRTADRNADYILHSCMGHDVLKYPGIRIFVTGENVSPNFGISDYAMAFDKMTFGDRYCWLPLIRLYPDAYHALCSPRPPAAAVFSGKTGFCSYVMSNLSDSAVERTQIYDLLAAYKPVHSGGRWRNNVGGPVEDKIAFQSEHKFAIAFENASTPGYLTEKFAQAAQSNAVPIYWGDPDIGKLFNPKAFVNCHEFKSLAEAVERVKQIDADDSLYRQMLSEPWFPGGEEPDCLRAATYVRFLSNIFDQPYETAFRRNRGRWGIKAEKRLYDMAFRPHVQVGQIVRMRWRDFICALRP